MFRPQKKPVKEEVDNSADAALERAVRSRKRENKNLKRLAVPNRQRPSDNALQANNVRFKGHRLSKTISMPCLGHPAFSSPARAPTRAPVRDKALPPKPAHTGRDSSKQHGNSDSSPSSSRSLDRKYPPIVPDTASSQIEMASNSSTRDSRVKSSRTSSSINSSYSKAPSRMTSRVVASAAASTGSGDESFASLSSIGTPQATGSTESARKTSVGSLRSSQSMGSFSDSVKEPRQTRTTRLRQQANQQSGKAASTSGPRKPSVSVSQPKVHQTAPVSRTHIAQLGGKSPDLPIEDGELVISRQRYAGLLEAPQSSPSRLPRRASSSTSTPGSEVQLTSLPAHGRSKLSISRSVDSDEDMSLPLVEEPSCVESTADWSSPVEGSSYFKAASSSDHHLTPTKSKNGTSDDHPATPSSHRVDQTSPQAITPSDSILTSQSSYGYKLRERRSARDLILGPSTDNAEASEMERPSFGDRVGEKIKKIKGQTGATGTASSVSSLRKTSASSRSVIPVASSNLSVGGSQDNKDAPAKEHGTNQGTLMNISVLRSPCPSETPLGSPSIEHESATAPAPALASSEPPSDTISSSKDIHEVPARAPRQSTLHKPTAASAFRQSANAARISAGSATPAGPTATAAGTGTGTRKRINTFVRKSCESLNRALPKRQSGSEEPNRLSAASRLSTTSKRDSARGEGEAKGRKLTKVLPSPPAQSAEAFGAAANQRDGDEAAGNGEIQVGEIQADEPNDPVADVIDSDEHLAHAHEISGLMARQMTQLLVLVEEIPHGALRDDFLQIIEQTNSAAMMAREELVEASEHGLRAANRVTVIAGMVTQVYNACSMAVLSAPVD